MIVADDVLYTKRRPSDLLYVSPLLKSIDRAARSQEDPKRPDDDTSEYDSRGVGVINTQSIYFCTVKCKEKTCLSQKKRIKI